MLKENKKIDLHSIKKVHFTGIKGVGMASLALCAQDMGMKISGSDISERFVTDEILKKREISWEKSFSSDNISANIDLLVFTASHGGTANEEVLSALEKQIPVLSQGQAVGRFMEGKIGISACGVGGKTTTAAMMSIILDKAKFYPSFAVGAGSIDPLGPAGRYDQKGKYFVAEADEYFDPSKNCPKFLFQNPKIIILTNIEHDHPDVYPDLDSTMKAYIDFISRLPEDGLLVANQDSFNVRRLLKRFKKAKFKIRTFGFSEKSDFQIKNYKVKNQKVFFKLNEEKYFLKVPGHFNTANAAAAAIAAKHLGLTYQQIKKGLSVYGGTKRRFEKVAEKNGIFLYDDYAHHPLEIKAVLKAAKEWFKGKRIIVVFQSHTYSRTKSLLKSFAASFNNADKVIISEIYPSAREKKDPEINGRILAEEIKKQQKSVIYKKDCQSVCRFLKDNIKKGDVIITIGAGDIFLWRKEISKLIRGVPQNTSEVARQPAGLLRGECLEIKKNIILAPYTSFGIGGPAEYFIEAKDSSQIIEAIKWAESKKIPFRILGGGTNILISDKGVKGLVIKLATRNWKLAAGELICDAGCPAHLIAVVTAKKGLSGLHHFAGLPGTVGGALYKNSHWCDHSYSDYLVEAEVLDKNLKKRKIKKTRLNFSYDWSDFQKNDAIIISAKFKLENSNSKDLQKEIQNILKRRLQNHPRERSAGCVFKNISGRSAGRFIEQTGLKGKIIGGAQISVKHANFLINKNNAKASEIMKLIKEAQKRAKNKFNIALEPEIFFWGEF